MEMIFFAAGVACGVALLAFWPTISGWFVAEEKGLEAKAKDAVSKEVKKVL